MTEKTDKGPEKKRRHRTDRRQFVQTMVSLGIAGTIVSFFSLLASLLPTAGAGEEEGQVDNVFKYGPDKGTWYSDKSGTDVKLGDFDEVGKGAGVLWRGRYPAIVIRVDESKLQGATATNGLIAFAASCTHLCCIATWHLDRPNQDVLYCRCHDGAFDPYDIVKDVMLGGAGYSGAKVIAGPPPRAAPIIPIEITDGKVAGVAKDLGLYDYCG
jgi:Rieske Fe-S protein